MMINFWKIVRHDLDGRFLNVTYAGQDQFQVIDDFTTFVVNLNSKEYGCRIWQIIEFPCKHVCDDFL